MKTNTTTLFKTFVLSGLFLSCFSALAQPVITLNGNSTIYIGKGSNYISQGATATDSIDGNLTDSIKVVSDVTTEYVGIYTENYSVKNSRSQTASVVRTVVVKNDVTPPQLTLAGDDTIFIEASRTNPSFSDPGAYASDNSAPFNLSSSIIVNGTVNTRRTGIYILTYDVQDVSGNTSTKTRIVIVCDTRAPEWIRKNSPHYLPFGKPFVDSVDIIDAYDASIAFTFSHPVTGAVDVNTPGQYDYIYVAEADSSGNRADTLFKTYIVQAKVSVEETNVNMLRSYPNPSKDVLHIQMKIATEGAQQIQLYDATGKLVSATIVQWIDSRLTIQTGELSNGIYYVYLEMGGKIYSEKFVKE